MYSIGLILISINMFNYVVEKNFFFIVYVDMYNIVLRKIIEWRI